MTYSDDDTSDDGGGSWQPSCDICSLLYSIKSTVEGNQNRLNTLQTALNNMSVIFNANFNTDFPWEYQYKENCGDETNQQYTGTGKGIPALVQQNRDLAKLMQAVQQSTCNNDNAPVIPEWWQLRPEADRPQLVILCAPKKPDGTLGSAKYVVTIPHYRYSTPHAFAPFYSLSKGSFQGITTLKDNSKIIIYGNTALHTRQVLLALDSEIDSAYRLPFNPKVGPIGNPNFAEITVYPKYGKYFSTGARKTVPDWVVRYETN